MNNIKITNSTLEDINLIMDIIKDAKTFLRSFNSPQWQGTYPNKELIESDIQANIHYSLFVNDTLAGIMTIISYDENYNTVYEGAFSNLSYYAVHRIAVKGEFRNLGLAKELLKFAEYLAKVNNIASIRIDTHKLNIPLQKALLNVGYQYIGIIHLKNNDDFLRLAYEKIIE